MATANLRRVLLRFLRLLKLKQTKVVALLFAVTLLAVSLTFRLRNLWDRKATTALRLTIWQRALVRELVEAAVALLLTILVLLIGGVLWDWLRHSRVGRKILSGKNKFILLFLMVFFILLALFPLLPSETKLLREMQSSPEKLAEYVGDLLVSSTLAATFWVTSKLAARRININTASKEELESLPGIGPMLAQRIIEYREQAGPFEKIEDIREVPGIGDKLINQIKYEVKV